MTSFLDATVEAPTAKKRSKLRRFCYFAATLTGIGFGAYASVERVVSAFDRSSQALQLAAQNRVRTDNRFEELLKGCLDGRQHTHADPFELLDSQSGGKIGGDRSTSR
jgi:hypothetical protein